MPGGPKQLADTRTLTVVAFSATAGVFIEWYDFFIYGYAAASAFPAIFFELAPIGLLFYWLSVRGSQPGY